MHLVACITFGHSTADVERALGSASRLASTRNDLRVVSIDDRSGMPPAPGDLTGIEYLEMPTRSGFPAVVNHLCSEVAPDCSKLVLINPDAVIDDSALSSLIEHSADVAVPSIGDGDVLENVRLATTPAAQLRALMFGERSAARRAAISVQAPAELACPPHAFQGSVVSLRAELLRQLPLDPVMFWLEMSDWLRRWQIDGRQINLFVGSEIAQHAGASSAVSFPLSVAASQARAKAAYIQRYGTTAQRRLLPFALVSRGVRFALKRRSPRAGLFLVAAALGRRDWRVDA